jgi:ribose transport system substrate-binding protein
MSVRYLMDIAASESRLPMATTHPDWRAIVLLPETHDPFYLQVADALEKNAREHGLALEFRPLPMAQDREMALRTLELAITAHPGGLIIPGSANPDYVNLIDKAVASKIPVITVATDSPASKRQTFVGTNGFSLGLKAGEFIEQNSAENARIGVILSQPDPVASDINNQSIIAGLAQALKHGGQRRITETRSDLPEALSSEEITADLIDNHHEVTVLFYTSSKDAIAAAQHIVDRNRVGQVMIIGVDDPPELVDYLRKGIIAATILRNPDNIGRLSIESLVELKTSNNSSSFRDPGIRLVTRNTLADAAGGLRTAATWGFKGEPRERAEQAVAPATAEPPR